MTKGRREEEKTPYLDDSVQQSLFEVQRTLLASMSIKDSKEGSLHILIQQIRILCIEVINQHVSVFHVPSSTLYRFKPR